MRQIDNMTAAEIDTLKLKGILGSKTTSTEAILQAKATRTIPAEKPTVIKTSQPMSKDDCKRSDYYVKWLATKAHADKLAEALRLLSHATRHILTWDDNFAVLDAVSKALAAYEAAQ